jgi:hypothetical protein
MPAANKFNSYVEYLSEKVIQQETDVLKLLLTDVAPVATNTVKANLTEIAAGNGYSAGGATVTVSSSGQAAGLYKLVLADVVFTASGGAIAQFRYYVLYDDTPTSPADPLMLWWDHGAEVNLASGETFTVDFDATAGVLTIQ